MTIYNKQVMDAFERRYPLPDLPPQYSFELTGKQVALPGSIIIPPDFSYGRVEVESDNYIWIYNTQPPQLADNTVNRTVFIFGKGTAELVSCFSVTIPSNYGNEAMLVTDDALYFSYSHQDIRTRVVTLGLCTVSRNSSVSVKSWTLNDLYADVGIVVGTSNTNSFALPFKRIDGEGMELLIAHTVHIQDPVTYRLVQLELILQRARVSGSGAMTLRSEKIVYDVPQDGLPYFGSGNFSVHFAPSDTAKNTFYTSILLMNYEVNYTINSFRDSDTLAERELIIDTIDYYETYGYSYLLKPKFNLSSASDTLWYGCRPLFVRLYIQDGNRIELAYEDGYGRFKYTRFQLHNATPEIKRLTVVGIDSNENVYLYITVEGTTYNSYLCKVDGAGNTLWTVAYEMGELRLPQFNYTDSKFPALFDSNGNLILRYENEHGTFFSNYFIVFSSKDGKILWWLTERGEALPKSDSGHEYRPLFAYWKINESGILDILFWTYLYKTSDARVEVNRLYELKLGANYYGFKGRSLWLHELAPLNIKN